MSEEKVSVWKNPRYGFRVMPWDPVAVLLCAAGVWWAWSYIGHWSLIAPFVLGNFFLFCNVFRVRRSYELWWAAAFLVNAVTWLVLSPSLLGIVLGQVPITALVIALEARSERYHGIFASPS